MAGVGSGPPSVTNYPMQRDASSLCTSTSDGEWLPEGLLRKGAATAGRHLKPLCLGKGLCSRLLGDISSESFLRKMSSGSAHSPALLDPKKNVLGWLPRKVLAADLISALTASFWL